MKLPDFPVAFEDHWGEIHILKSTKASKELFDTHMKDYVNDIDDEYLSGLVFAADVSGNSDDWYAVIEYFAQEHADECWYFKYATVYE